MNLFLQSVVNGLVLASVYALVALGLTLVFGVLDIVNFAQGQVLLLAAYLLYGLSTRHIGYWEGLLIVFVGAGVFGYVLDTVLFARVRTAPVNGLLLSIGLISVFENLIQRVWGPDQYQVRSPISTNVSLGKVQIAGGRLLVIGMTLGVLALIALSLRFTRPGIALRAVAQNPDAAALMGISVERSRHIAFAASAALAALGGALLAAMFPISPSLSDSPLLKGFIVLILGGAGSPLGAVLGAVILGISESFGIAYWSPSGTQVMEFVLLIAVLFVRPTGLIKTRYEISL